MTEIKKIGVIGEGKMGGNIFSFLRDFDFELFWICSSADEADKQLAGFIKKTGRQLKNGLIDTKSHDYRIENSYISHDLQKLYNCDLVIECIYEATLSKIQLLKEVENYVKPDCIIASNTSSILPTRLFSALDYKTMALGMHFFYPLGLRNIVEINLSPYTSEKALQLVKQFLTKIGRKHIVLPEEYAFILNRLFLDFQVEAFNLMKEHKLTYRQMDQLVTRHLFPIGVFEFFDSVGIDIMLLSIRNYTHFSAHPKFHQPLLDCLGDLLGEGRLGQKSKAGFFDYSEITEKVDEPALKNEKELVERLRLFYLLPIIEFARKGICSEDKIDHAFREYLSVDKGPVTMAKEMGVY
jgi:3-hydroxyacyl-CoA dehydrogenase